MYRDFSENSKQNLLGFVSEVENEKICDFTDWVGDRWYDFEEWIGQLNIRNYLNNVNEYHKKVIDKNNATQSSIKKIFDNVKLVDISYKNTLDLENTQLLQWQQYITQLSEIVNPSNGRFEAKYMSDTLNEILNDINKNTVDVIRKSLEKDFDELTDYEKSQLIEFIYKDVRYMTIDEKELLAEIMKDSDKIEKILMTLQMGMNSISSRDYFILHEGEEQPGIEAVKLLVIECAKYIKGMGSITNNDKLKISENGVSLIAALIGAQTADSRIEFVKEYLKIIKTEGNIWKKVYKNELQKLKILDEENLKNIFTSSKSESIIDALKFELKYGKKVADVGIIANGAGCISLLVDAWGKEYSEILLKSGDYASSGASLAEAIYSRWYFGNEEALKAIKDNRGDIMGLTGGVAISGAAIGRYRQIGEKGYYTWDDLSDVYITSGLAGASSVISGTTYGLVNLDIDSSREIFNQNIKQMQDTINSQEWSLPTKVLVGFAGSVIVAGESTVEIAVDTVADTADRFFKATSPIADIVNDISQPNKSSDVRIYMKDTYKTWQNPIFKK